MQLAPKQVGLQTSTDIADLPTGGAVVLPGATVIDQYRSVSIAQTTAGQSATLPDPSDTSIKYSLPVFNTGAVDLTMYGVTISAGAMALFGWNGSAWVPDVAPTITSEIEELLTPTGTNVIPDLANSVAAGSLVKIEVNGQGIHAGITVDAAGAFTVVPATVGFNVDVTDEVWVKYTAA